MRWEHITRSNFIIRLKRWEYWPFGIIQFPLFIYFMWLALKERSLTFFSSANPGILMGGMFGESKFEVLKKVPKHLVPKTILISQPASVHDVAQKIRDNGFRYPVIFKPDIGERGFMVKRILSESDIASYLETMPYDFLVQELVDMPLEFGVFYTRFPGEERGRVTSVVMKEMLSVTGNGKFTLRELILNKDRAKLQWATLQHTFRDRLETVLPANETITLVSVGNHCLGAKFLNGNHLINEQLHTTFDAISKEIDGFYFGRYDLRCETVNDLYHGNVKILELNGCGAEPAHIYEPGFPLLHALKVLFEHWRNISLIARQNSSRGFSYIPLRDAIRHYRRFKVQTSAKTL